MRAAASRSPTWACIGIKSFTAIINPPQSCILAVGAGEERAVVKDGKVEIATVMTVTMSCRPPGGRRRHRREIPGT